MAHMTIGSLLITQINSNKMQRFTVFLDFLTKSFVLFDYVTHGIDLLDRRQLQELQHIPCHFYTVLQSVRYVKGHII